jgi:hypothetical protein
VLLTGCPDWDYRAKIWRPVNESGDFDKDEQTGKTIVYFVIQVRLSVLLRP